MINNQGFPVELLDKSIEERINYFNGYIANHPSINNIYNDLWETVENNGSYSMVYVFGPTGVGKTTLYNKVIKNLYKDEESNMAKNHGIIPFLGTRAIAPEYGNFDWKDFYMRTLEKLNEPLIGKKVLLSKEDDIKYNAYHNDKTTKAYRKSVENALKYRKTKVWLIDEAQHMAKLSSGKKLLNQMDVIKSLAAETGTLIILFGTYSLQSFLNLSDQLSRRGKEIHFPRYKYDNKEELSMFENVLWSFQKHLPLKNGIELVNHVNFFYERSLGCIGILKNWIERTYSTVLLKNNTELTIEDFNKTALSISQCITIAEEIVMGEREQEETEEQRLSLIKKIGMSPINEGNNQAKMNKKVKNQRVGERSPKRDEVGVEKYAQ